jgi:hypothetical protein
MYCDMEVPSPQRATITVMEAQTKVTRRGDIPTNVEALYCDKSKSCYCHHPNLQYRFYFCSHFNTLTSFFCRQAFHRSSISKIHHCKAHIIGAVWISRECHICCYESDTLLSLITFCYDGTYILHSLCQSNFKQVAEHKSMSLE